MAGRLSTLLRLKVSYSRPSVSEQRVMYVLNLWLWWLICSFKLSTISDTHLETSQYPNVVLTICSYHDSPDYSW